MHEDAVTPENIIADIAEQVKFAFKDNTPLFLIVYYDHEEDKISFLNKLRGEIKKHGLMSKTFDPAHRVDHDAARLYPLLRESSVSKTLCLISGLPHENGTIKLEEDFLENFNIRRDAICRDNIRMVLFLHSIEAEQFILKAGDLWDFRHHTYWLHKELPQDRKGFLQALGKISTELPVPEKDREEISRHTGEVYSLVEETKGPEEKAGLLLDLTRWLHRRYAYSLAIKTAHRGISFIPSARSSLRANLENELGYALMESSHLPEALNHYEQSLAISREIGDRMKEGVTCWNLALEWERRGNMKKAIEYGRYTVAIEDETSNPDLEKSRKYLAKLENQLHEETQKTS